MPATKFCARCGFELKPSQRIKSKHTGFSYCLHLNECERRAHGDLTYEEIVMYAEQLTAALKV